MTSTRTGTTSLIDKKEQTNKRQVLKHVTVLRST